MPGKTGAHLLNAILIVLLSDSANLLCDSFDLFSMKLECTLEAGVVN